jgi:hypothetical protein
MAARRRRRLHDIILQRRTPAPNVSFWLSPPQPHARAAAVFVNEFDASLFEGGADFLAGFILAAIFSSIAERSNNG